MGKGVRQNLDGYLASKIGIERAIDFPGSALTDLGGDLVRTEPDCQASGPRQVAAIIGDAMATADT
jgi:hypothetical protein